MMYEYEAPAVRYRRLARECLEVAATFSDGERRDAVLQMAQVWQRLADQHIESASPSFQTRGGEQPTMQQQQQVQPTDEDKDKS
jgi:hypothetical protein